MDSRAMRTNELAPSTQINHRVDRIAFTLLCNHDVNRFPVVLTIVIINGLMTASGAMLFGGGVGERADQNGFCIGFLPSHRSLRSRFQ